MFKMVVGRLPQENGHHISTEFLSFVGPLVPLRSIYVTHEEVSRSPGRTTYHAHGVDLPLQWGSVALGYLRVWLGWAWAASPFVLFWGEGLDFDRPEWAVTAGLFASWLAVLIVPAIVARGGDARSRVLARATGVSVDPRRFDAIQRLWRRDELASRLAAAGVTGVEPSDPPSFAAHAVRAPVELLPTLYAYARYAAVDDAAWNTAAEEVWRALPHS